MGAERKRPHPLVARVGRLVERVKRWKAARAFVRYGEHRGPILASGLAYQALFAVFAGLWAAFSVAGLVVSGDSALRSSVLDVLRDAVPGLIDDGDGTGAIDPEILLSATVYNITGIIALAGLLVTALGWLAAARDSVRSMFDLPGPATNVLVRKLLDAALGIGLGALLVVAAGLSFAGTSATGAVLDWLRVDPDSVVGAIAGRAVSLVATVVVYAVALAGLYRYLSGIRLPFRLLRGGVLLGAVGIAALTIVSAWLLGGATNNPLIASFAVVAGLLIYYNFVCQIILVGASWIAVGAADEGLELDAAVAAARLEEARKLVAAHEPPAERRVPWWRRLFRRDRRSGDVGRPG